MMRRRAILAGGLALGSLLAVFVGTGWKRGRVPATAAMADRPADPVFAEKPLEDLVERYRLAAAI